jgi:xylulokinase
MSKLFLGLDIGTSSIKAAAFDADGRALAVSRVPQPVYTPQPSWAEQDPADWQAGAWRALRQTLAKVNPRQVVAVGLTGQCPSHALIDGDGKPLGRAIIWRDGRALQEAAWLRAQVSPQQATAWTGSSDLGDPTLPPARLLWLRNHCPDDWEKARYILQAKDLIGYYLTGETATDVHSAYCLAGPTIGGYASAYLELLGIPTGRLPVTRSATTFLGKVTPSAAELSGLPAGTPVAIGTIDAYCETIAGGGLVPGSAVDVAGTSEILSLGVAGQVTGEGVYLASLGPAGQFLCGPTQAGGETLRWLLRGFYPALENASAYRALEAEAGAAPPGCQGLVFLPYLSGERAPLWDPAVRGAYLGISLQHSRSHFTRAAYEGVGYAIRHILEVCEAAASLRAESLTVCGGASGSLFWNQIKADILQIPVFPAIIRETACLGAAILAAVAASHYTDLQEAGQVMARVGPVVEPVWEHVPYYEAGYRLYRAYYPALAKAYQK